MPAQAGIQGGGCGGINEASLDSRFRGKDGLTKRSGLKLKSIFINESENKRRRKGK